MGEKGEAAAAAVARRRCTSWALSACRRRDTRLRRSGCPWLGREQEERTYKAGLNQEWNRVRQRHKNGTVERLTIASHCGGVCHRRRGRRGRRGMRRRTGRRWGKKKSRENHTKTPSLINKWVSCRTVLLPFWGRSCRICRDGHIWQSASGPRQSPACR